VVAFDALLEMLDGIDVNLCRQQEVNRISALVDGPVRFSQTWLKPPFGSTH
jgi:hypothetical protein